MGHIDKTLDLSKDTYFNARISDARWDESANVWTLKSQQGHVAKGKYLILATGLLHRTYTPDFPGLSEYKGALHHTGAWPEDFDGKGKKIGLIGAGATAVQVTQELGKQADEMTVFLRRPSFCYAMQQRPLTVVEQHQMKPYYPALFKSGRDSAVGFPAERIDKGIFDVTPEEREKHLNAMWETGGFHFQLSGYNDTALNPEANKVQYDFWRRKICERLTDPAKQAIMAPEKAPYYLGTKRSPLEQDYYEVLNQSNVKIHDLGKAPLDRFFEKGMITADGQKHEFDAIVLATGFDSFTGSITRMGLKNKDGIDIKDLWADGVLTYLGITISGFPNCFMAYTPQAPTALSNGPTIIEAQIETIVDFIKKMEAEGVKSIEPKQEAQLEWKYMLNEMSKHTLFPFTDSWWNGSNIPGKKAENMNYIAGINTYEQQCRATMDGWKGFDVVKAN